MRLSPNNKRLENKFAKQANNFFRQKWRIPDIVCEKIELDSKDQEPEKFSWKSKTGVCAPFAQGCQRFYESQELANNRNYKYANSRITSNF